MRRNHGELGRISPVFERFSKSVNGGWKARTCGEERRVGDGDMAMQAAHGMEWEAVQTGRMEG